METIQRVDLRNFRYEAACFLSFARRWRCPLVFLDTEFPGTIHRPAKARYCLLSPEERYSLFIRNAEDHRPIQIGITLCHPIFNQISVTWQFDVRDFDVRVHPQAPESIALHESAGIDLERTRRLGVPSVWVARLLLDAGLVGLHSSAATWVAFQGGYDFAIMLKALMYLQRPPWLPLTRAKFPETAGDFRRLIRRLFGTYIYDLKTMMKGRGLHGGLESLAAQLDVKRSAGKAHQAGSDSLLTSQVFFRMKKMYFSGGEDGEDQLLAFDGIIAGF